MKKKINQLVLLNGGRGKRVKSVSKGMPKCLIKFKKKPFLYWQLLLFKKNGIKEIIICVGYKNKEIFSELKKIKINNLKIKIVKEKSLLGTGGAIKNCIKYLNDYFFITYGDSWLNLNFNNLKRKFLKKKKKFIISVISKKKIKNHSPNILINKNKILDYDKNNEFYNYIDYGLMIFNKNIFNTVRKRKFDLNYLVKKLIRLNSINFYKVQTKFYEIGSLEGIRDFKKFI